MNKKIVAFGELMLRLTPPSKQLIEQTSSFDACFGGCEANVLVCLSLYKANAHFGEGRYITSWNAQACLEWFPFSEEKGFKLFAHYLYKGHILSEKANALMPAMPDTQRASIGIQYIIPVL